MWWIIGYFLIGACLGLKLGHETVSRPHDLDSPGEWFLLGLIGWPVIITGAVCIYIADAIVIGTDRLMNKLFK
jgi:hypothetical protein